MINPSMFGYDAGGSAAAAGAGHAQTAANRASRDVTHLEDRFERLSLVCMAMWSLLQDKTDLTEEDLLERVRVIDLMDGVADGKATTGITKCAKCDRTMSPRHRRCIYCGADKPRGSAFDHV